MSNIKQQEYGKVSKHKDSSTYEEQLQKWAQKLDIDIDWLRKSSYTLTGKDFLTYGDHYNNIVNFLSEKNTGSYIYLKDFKFRMISTNGFIDFMEKKYKDQDDTKENEDLNKSWSKSFDSVKYHFLMYGDIHFNQAQWARLMEITGLSSEDLALEQFSIPKDKAVLSGGTAKIVKVYTQGKEPREEELGYIKYDVDYGLYTNRSGSAALKYLPKTIKTRTMREALKQVYTFDFAMMAHMAGMEVIDEIEVALVDSMSENNNNVVIDESPTNSDLIAAKKADKIRQAMLEEQKDKEWTKEEMDKAISNPWDTSVGWATVGELKDEAKQDK